MKRPSIGFSVAVLALAGLVCAAMFTRVRWLWDPAAKQADVREFQEIESRRIGRETRASVHDHATQAVDVPPSQPTERTVRASAAWSAYQQMVVNGRAHDDAREAELWAEVMAATEDQPYWRRLALEARARVQRAR